MNKLQRSYGQISEIAPNPERKREQFHLHTDMSQLQIVSGPEAGIDMLAEGFNLGFQDYKYGGTSFTADEMQHRLDAQGILLADCAVLLAQTHDGDRGMGMALLARQTVHGWCGGLAVAPSVRRQGWAAQLMVSIQNRARTLDISTICLEVLVENIAAQELYTRLGYQQRRELWIWECAAANDAGLQDQAGLDEIAPCYQVLPVPPAEILRGAPAWYPSAPAWYPSAPAWQRAAHHLRYSQEQMAGLSLIDSAGQPLAYALYRPPRVGHDKLQVRIEDLVIASSEARHQIGEMLLQALLTQYPEATFILLNEPADSPLNSLLQAAGFGVVERQYEMVRSL